MDWSIAEIAAALGAEAEGDVALRIRRPAEPAAAQPDELALAMDPRYAEGLARGQARAAVLWADADWRAMGLVAAIRVPRSRLAMAGLTRLMDPGPDLAPGIHPSAVIDPGAEIGAGASVGPFVVIGAGVRIGARVRIASHVSLGRDVRIGDDALILEGVRIGARVAIGDRLIAHPGAVIGSDGFSFVTVERSGVEEVRATLGKRDEIKQQSWIRIHSLGAVSVGDDVEVGANTTIDRGTIRDTVIGDRVKLDNLVQIGHNVRLGADCLCAAQTAIGGSTVVGDRVVFGGKSGAADNIRIGNDVICGGGTILLTNTPAGQAMLGYPGMPMKAHIESYKGFRRLPRLFQQVAELQKAVFKRDGSE